MASRPEVVFEGVDFGEGPRWHDGRLWFSDFYAHRVSLARRRTATSGSRSSSTTSRAVSGGCRRATCSSWR